MHEGENRSVPFQVTVKRHPGVIEDQLEAKARL